MEDIDTKNIDIILQELTTKIADLKQNESDIQGVISICYSLHEELIIFKHRISARNAIQAFITFYEKYSPYGGGRDHLCPPRGNPRW